MNETQKPDRSPALSCRQCLLSLLISVHSLFFIISEEVKSCRFAYTLETQVENFTERKHYQTDPPFFHIYRSKRHKHDSRLHTQTLPLSPLAALIPSFAELEPRSSRRSAAGRRAHARQINCLFIRQTSSTQTPLLPCLRCLRS